jgi:N-acetylglucosaminyl-diphospho-decaprenol L-rhamnosyltransferase
MQLSISIVNYNVKYFLEHCLLSVISACKQLDAEILVVDNNSTDGSRAYLEPKFATVKFYWNKDNVGFGAANNFALAYAKGTHVLFLNPDTIVSEDCFVKSLAFFETHNDCGAVGVRMIDGSGHFLRESKRSLPTASGGFYKMLGLAELFPASKIFSQYYAGHLVEKENSEVPVLAGAYMMLSREAIKNTNGFDETFFMYGEDIDLSYRITRAGLKNYYLGQSTIIHFKGESTQKLSAGYINYFYGAIKHFVDKHYHKNVLKQTAMKAVILSGKMFATVKAKFINETKPNKHNNAIKTLVITSRQAEATVFSLLDNTVYANNESFYVDANTNQQEIMDRVVKQKFSAVVLCTATISNAVAINLLQQLPNNCMALFYEAGAASIVGSNDKNARGLFIANH